MDISYKDGRRGAHTVRCATSTVHAQYLESKQDKDLLSLSKTGPAVAGGHFTFESRDAVKRIMEAPHIHIISCDGGRVGHIQALGVQRGLGRGDSI